jgi:hypothetical protein
VLYFFLGLERWSFGDEFFWWQLTSLLLHLGIAWLLLKILLGEGKHVFAPLLVLFFSVQYAAMEMVIWHHMSGYLLFCVFLLSAIYNLRRYEREGSSASLYLLYASLVLASFTYELGSAASLLIAGYMVMNNVLGHKRYGWLIVIAVFAIPAVYAATSMTDLYLRFGNLGVLGELNTGDGGGGGFCAALINILHALQKWFVRGIVPQSIDTLVGERVILREVMPLMSSVLFKNTMLAIMTIILYLCIVGKVGGREFFKKNIGFILLVSLLILSYASIIVFGRIRLRGFDIVMLNNSYYAYIPNLLVLIMSYAALNVSRIAQGGRVFFLLKAIFAVGLLAIVWGNAERTYKVNAAMHRHSRPVNSLVHEINDLVAEQAHEKDFSFSISPNCPGSDPIRWLKRRGDAPGKAYSLAEALYPKHYVLSNGKYRVTCERGEVKSEKVW